MKIKELKFPVVFHEESMVGYGGNQEWFTEIMKQRAGCGCTSGANLAAYYASNFSAMNSVYDGNRESFSQGEYLSAMEKMYRYMTPGVMGYPYVRKFGNQFVKFCAEHGIYLEPVYCLKFNKTEDAVAYMKECIDEGHPIALLILFHRAHSLKEDNWHWVTITGYAEDEDGLENLEVIMSNCGERQIVKGSELFEVHRRNTIRMVSFRFQQEHL
ncbi:hypothetical protein FRZ06_08295 [Anoxybacterium hadale]|uniref:Uncharacterized protein n=1 Tax=Anoxybacterium hadale TaxID=3408580 RepID=A0ACD1AA51_9FIRM|nr:hypothetical protein FRZ06_08295 [Clostridiales bacterium]